MDQSKNYPRFAIIFAIGVGFIILAVFMLPWIFFKPSSVSNLFNLGSITIMASFAVLWGPAEFVKKMLFSGEKKFYAIGYLISLVLCIYFGVIRQSYIMTFVTLILEIGFLLYLVACFFPGGKEGLTSCLKAAWSMIKSCCSKGAERLNRR